jgi:hypothetical protein
MATLTTFACRYPFPTGGGFFFACALRAPRRAARSRFVANPLL